MTEMAKSQRAMSASRRSQLNDSKFYNDPNNATINARDRYQASMYGNEFERMEN